MKKLSSISLISVLVVSISAFSFCSNSSASVNTTNSEAAVKAIKNEGLAQAVPEVIKTKKLVDTTNSTKEPLAKGTIEKDGLTWYTDLQLAHKKSTETGKPVLGFFTGSDWCGWCFKLHDNVLVKDEFLEWAEENVVLMEIDFPRRTALDPELKAQNDNLQKVFNVSGFPTVWYFTTEVSSETGKLNLTALGKTGYPRAPAGQEATAFIAASDAIIMN